MLIWKKNRDSVYTEVNELCASVFGYNKPEQMVSVTDYDVPCKLSESADVFRSHDCQVMTEDKSIKLLEISCCANDDWKIFITTKSPLKNNNNEMIGTIAHALEVTTIFKKMPSLMSMLYNTDDNKLRRNTFTLTNKSSIVAFSKQQTECIFHLLRGKTSKQIAKLMRLAPKTVEHYIDNIKNKTNCHSKNELIDHLISLGYFNLVPEHILQKPLSIILT